MAHEQPKQRPTRKTVMSNDQARRVVLDRAERMVKQSRILRKLAEELMQESKDLRASAKRTGPKNDSVGKRKIR